MRISIFDYVKKQNAKFVFLLSLLAFCMLGNLAMANDESGNKKENPMAEKIELLNTELLDLEVSYEMGEDAFEVGIETSNIKNQLLHYEYQLGTPKGNDTQWNETEKMILETKIKINQFKEKIKLEGDWGKLRFRIQDFRTSDPGAVKLRYNYGF